MSENDHSDCGHCCGGHEHEPSAGDLVQRPEVDAAQKTTLRVAGMDCPNEIKAIEQAVLPIPGVAAVSVNLVGGKATVSHDGSVPHEKLIAAIGAAGLKAELDEPSSSDISGTDRRAHLMSVAASGILTGIGMVLEWTKAGPGWLAIGVFTCAIIVGWWFIMPKTIGALRRLSLDMNVLMTVAVVGAMAIGQWSESASVVFLFSLAELLEGLSLGRARRAIQSLMQLSPNTAFLKEGDSLVEVPVEQVKVGDTIGVKSGSRVPLDGEILSGNSAINQAPITGESLPVEKKPGDTVFAGTINGEGSLSIRVTKISADTTLARIIHLVEEAQSQKAPSQRFVDAFAKYYTPAVFAIALLVWLIPPLFFAGAWLAWTYRALVLLVIACPCALVISTPVSIVSGLTALARHGVLIKGGAVLEAVGKLRALAVDKTGTITQGQPRVTRVVHLNSSSDAKLLRIAAAIDVHSEHPLAQAVVNHARAEGIKFPVSESYRAQNGRGAEGVIDGHDYFVGNHRFTHELAVCSEEVERTLAEIEDQAQSVVVVGHKPHAGCKGEVLGVLAIGDTIRPNAEKAIRSLHDSGIAAVVMLSGDNQRTVNAIAKEAGIDEAFGDLLPEQKVERVRELMSRHKNVGMIGDGVNDAPAMATASVGIAMGAAGTDTALETADMALMQDDLCKVADAIHLGRRTVRVIQTNIGFALGVKAIFLVLALSGHTSLWLAILADTGATLVVIANALRLLRL